MLLSVKLPDQRRRIRIKLKLDPDNLSGSFNCNSDFPLYVLDHGGQEIIIGIVMTILARMKLYGIAAKNLPFRSGIIIFFYYFKLSREEG